MHIAQLILNILSSPKVYWLNLNFPFGNARTCMLMLQTGMLNYIYDDITPKYLVREVTKFFLCNACSFYSNIFLAQSSCSLTNDLFYSAIYNSLNDFELRLLHLHELIYISLGCLYYILKNQYISLKKSLLHYLSHQGDTKFWRVKTQI